MSGQTLDSVSIDELCKLICDTQPVTMRKVVAHFLDQEVEALKQRLS